MTDMRADVERWDVHVERRWPLFTQAVPPVTVRVAVEFTTDASTVEFERQVREILTGR